MLWYEINPLQLLVCMDFTVNHLIMVNNASHKLVLSKAISWLLLTLLNAHVGKLWFLGFQAKPCFLISPMCNSKIYAPSPSSSKFGCCPPWFCKISTMLLEAFLANARNYISKMNNMHMINETQGIFHIDLRLEGYRYVKSFKGLKTRTTTNQWAPHITQHHTYKYINLYAICMGWMGMKKQ